MNKELYNKIRKKLPVAQRVQLSKLVFRLLRKPMYSAENKVPQDKGVVTLSADFELAWAWRFSKKNINAAEMGRREREHFPLILAKLNDLDIPITWATVGHLFLDNCKKHNGLAHAELHRPHYFENIFWTYNKGDWYDLDPCTDYKTNPEFYGPDLIEMILNSKTKHEIGCHSFSHCDFTEKNSYPELIYDELNACEEAMKRFGIKPVSFVFPGNQVGSINILKDKDYKIIRHKTDELKEIGFPEVIDGMFSVHDSLSLEIDEKEFGSKYMVWKLKKYVDKAIEKKAICHLWFHPSIDKENMLSYFFPLLDYISEKRDKGELEVLTMEQIEKRYNRNEK